MMVMQISVDWFLRIYQFVVHLEATTEIINKLNGDYEKAVIKLKNSQASLEMKRKIGESLRMQYNRFEKEMEDIIRVRLESNDALMKLHKEIFEQKSKLERAQREQKTARKTAMQNVSDRDYMRVFEVRLFHLSLNFTA